MRKRDIVVVGASAGGVEALRRFLGRLPADFPGAVFVVLHIPAESPSVLPTLLTRLGGMPAAHAVDGEPLRQGRIYVAPPDHHLTLSDGHVAVTRGPRENGVRPAVDPLFRTAARLYRDRVIGVVLSGTLDDGAAGLHAIKLTGGVAIVQDPEDALFAGMPLSSLEIVEVDFQLPAAEIADTLMKLTSPEAKGRGPITGKPRDEIGPMSSELKIGAPDVGSLEGQARPGEPSVYACPECHGVLWELRDGQLAHFRCRVGHAYTLETLFADHTQSVETALWTALRSLEERVSLSRRLAHRARERGQERMATTFERSASEVADSARILRDLLLGDGAIEGVELADVAARQDAAGQ